MSNEQNANLRVATKSDFILNAKLVDEFGTWVLKRHYSEGVWEARCNGNEKCLFDTEAQFYKVAI